MQPLDKSTVQHIHEAKQQGRDISDWDVSREIRKHLGKREVVLLIDDSSHMEQHHKDMVITLGSLLLLTKETDPNGLEAYLTSDPHRRIKPFRPLGMGLKKLDEVVRDKLSSGGGPDRCIMEKALSVVLDRIMPSKWRFKPTTLLVMTDGDWNDDWHEGQSARCGSEKPIIDAIKRLKDWKKLRFDLSIQFIRFGHHSEGIRRLEHLDNFLRSSEEFESW